MNYLSVENLTKNYGDITLFENISFGINKGEKTALIANNGTGKSTLFNVLAGYDSADGGEIAFRDGISIGFLEQEPVINKKISIKEYISTAGLEINQVIKRYKKALASQEENFNNQTQKTLEEATTLMDKYDAWDYERKMQEILSRFRITELDQQVHTLSGGQQKRLALAMVLLNNPEFLILDEPTNHLDIDMIEWLESYLFTSGKTLLMVTHDRYFLDRVCNHILELSNGKLYHHAGNYEYFLRKKAERQQNEATEIDKAKNLLRKELDWMRRMPKARGTKSKARKDAFYETKEIAESKKPESELKLHVKVQRIGGKILELDKVNKSFGDIKILDNFSYIFKKGERIGIIGKNGTGKTTFLDILTGKEKQDSGTIDTGETIAFGYYKQKGLEINEDKRVIEVVKDIAEVIPAADGSMITASQFLQHFLFSPEVQHAFVSQLSGGEKRRLHLLTVLMKNPNFLILDEPTNDLDIITLNKLEEFLGQYNGCLIIVSHDRYFLDKLTDHLFVFEGDGTIKDFTGNYTQYRQKKALQEKKSKPPKATGKKPKPPANKPKSRKKLSYKEQRELEQLEKEIEVLELEKEELENKLNSGAMAFEELQDASKRVGELIETIDEKMMRWMELDELKNTK